MHFTVGRTTRAQSVGLSTAASYVFSTSRITADYLMDIRNRIVQRHPFITHVFSVDLRAVAVFRVLIGCLVVSEMIRRIPVIDVFYSNKGVLPYETTLLQDVSPVLYYLPRIPDDGWLWFGLILVTIIAAIPYIAGYHARFAAVILSVLLLFVYARNPFILRWGSFLLRYAVLFSIFLPLDARFSIRQAYTTVPTVTSNSIVTTGSAGLLLQLVVLYLVNFYQKIRGDVWHTGDALFRIYNVDTFTTTVGDWVAAYPDVLTVFTYVWLLTILLAPLLLLPTRIQPYFNAVFIVAHIWILLSTTSGVFPLITITTHVLLFREPTITAISNRLTPHIPRQSIDSSLSSLQPLSRLIQLGDAFFATPSIKNITQTYSPIFGVFFILLLVTSAVYGVGIDTPDVVVDTVETTQFTQQWAMFAPTPPNDYRRSITTGTFTNNTTLNLQTRTPPDYHALKITKQTYPTAYHRLYYTTLYQTSSDDFRRQYANHYCEVYSQSNESLETVTIHSVEITFHASNQTTSTSNITKLHTHWC